MASHPLTLGLGFALGVYALPILTHRMHPLEQEIKAVCL